MSNARSHAIAHALANAIAHGAALEMAALESREQRVESREQRVEVETRPQPRPKRHLGDGRLSVVLALAATP